MTRKQENAIYRIARLDMQQRKERTFNKEPFLCKPLRNAYRQVMGEFSNNVFNDLPTIKKFKPEKYNFVWPLHFNLGSVYCHTPEWVQPRLIILDWCILETN